MIGIVYELIKKMLHGNRDISILGEFSFRNYKMICEPHPLIFHIFTNRKMDKKETT